MGPGASAPAWVRSLVGPEFASNRQAGCTHLGFFCCFFALLGPLECPPWLAQGPGASDSRGRWAFPWLSHAGDLAWTPAGPAFHFFRSSRGGSAHNPHQPCPTR